VLATRCGQHGWLRAIDAGCGAHDCRCQQQDGANELESEQAAEIEWFVNHGQWSKSESGFRPIRTDRYGKWHHIGRGYPGFDFGRDSQCQGARARWHVRFEGGLAAWLTSAPPVQGRITFTRRNPAPSPTGRLSQMVMVPSPAFPESKRLSCGLVTDQCPPDRQPQSRKPRSGGNAHCRHKQLHISQMFALSPRLSSGAPHGSIDSPRIRR